MRPFSLFRTASRQDGLFSLYIESIVDAYSQYFVNVIEHTENNKQWSKVQNLLFLPLEQVIVRFCMVFP